MGRERKDYYQLKRAVGEDPVLEASLVGAQPTGLPAEPVTAPVASPEGAKRKKKKAKRARSTSEADVEAEGEEGEQVEADQTDLPGGAVSPVRTAREEVILASLSSVVRST